MFYEKFLQQWHFKHLSSLVVSPNVEGSKNSEQQGMSCIYVLKEITVQYMLSVFALSIVLSKVKEGNLPFHKKVTCIKTSVHSLSKSKVCFTFSQRK